MYIAKWQVYGVLILVLILVAVVVYGTRKDISPQKAREVLENFCNDHVPEEMCDRYLLTAGKGVIPYLIVEIQNKNMPHRRYAIGALGKIGDRWSLPALIHILEDSSEIYYFRWDACEAIWKIDNDLGNKLATAYSEQIEGLDRAMEITRKHLDEDSFSDKLIQFFKGLFYLITHIY